MTIEAAIFDMDGLLIDSEPVWRKVEIDVFGRFGITLREEQCLQTKGFRIDAVVSHWDRIFPGRIGDVAAAAERIVRGVEAELLRDAHPKPGAIAVIEDALSRGCKLAIASSSPTRLIDAAVRQLNLQNSIPVRCSAMDEEFGKPHPAVFLRAAKLAGVAPESCLAFEDSIYGVISAKAARMKCIAVPEGESDVRKFQIADVVLESLLEMQPEHWAL